MNESYRKHFVFQKEKCHPHNSNNYRKTMEHIVALFRKENLKEGVYGIAPGVFSACPGHPKSGNNEAWKNSSVEFYIYPSEDWDDETYDKFFRLIEEYPWEEFGIDKPTAI